MTSRGAPCAIASPSIFPEGCISCVALITQGPTKFVPKFLEAPVRSSVFSGSRSFTDQKPMPSRRSSKETPAPSTGRLGNLSRRRGRSRPAQAQRSRGPLLQRPHSPGASRSPRQYLYRELMRDEPLVSNCPSPSVSTQGRSFVPKTKPLPKSADTRTRAPETGAPADPRPDRAGAYPRFTGDGPNRPSGRSVRARPRGGGAPGPGLPHRSTAQGVHSHQGSAQSLSQTDRGIGAAPEPSPCDKYTAPPMTGRVRRQRGRS